MANEKQNEKNKEWIAEYVDDSVIIANGFDSSIIGYTVGGSSIRAVYDAETMAETLINDGCTYEEAWEYLEFNTFDAHIGEGTPIYMNRVNSKSSRFWSSTETEIEERDDI